MQRQSTRRVSQEELNRSQISGEIAALTAQRGELQAQMGELSRRRNQLDEQRHVAPSDAARSQLVARIAELDARSARIDAQIMGLNDRISTGMGRLAEVPSAPGRVVNIPEIRIPSIQVAPPGRRGPEMPGIAALMAVEAVAFALIGFVFWRIGMKRMREQFERMFASQTQQLTQVQQAVDVVAVEVERISEGQRYVAKVLTEGAPAASALPVGRNAGASGSRNG